MAFFLHQIANKVESWLLSMICEKSEKARLRRMAIRIRHIIVLIECLITILWAVILVSFISECLNSPSVFRLICNRPWPITKLMNEEAIQEVAKTIGISSILVIWIYAELGREQLGVKYSELLKNICPYYHLFVIIHIVTVLVCIWVTELKFIESSSLALLVISFGLVQQAIILITFILTPALRERLALDYWARELNYTYPQLEAFPILEAQLPYYKMNVCKEMCSIWVDGMFRYCFSDISRPSCILDASYRWEFLMHEKTESQQMLILERCFEALGTYPAIRRRERFAMCASYSLWYFRNLSLQQDDAHKLTLFLGMTNRLSGNISDSESIQCLQLLYNITSWTFFLSAKAPIICNQVSVFEVAPYKWADCKGLGIFFLNQVSEEALPDKICKIAWKQSIQD